MNKLFKFQVSLFKKYDRMLDLELFDNLFSVFYLGKEGPEVPFFFSIAAWRWEFGIERLLLDGEFGAMNWDRYRLFLYRLGMQETKIYYLPWRKN